MNLSFSSFRLIVVRDSREVNHASFAVRNPKTPA
ncbi:hypothetical protein GMORB2_2184 [Geosmithia morbida]|uniref:Uncharacterized protein n=1 Tax=Geosmithia morbida TaxID=1094350 RepID=A0A9P4YSX1_9HYPO|nr:uncharacterized protein GMORB2_2184 [Geosmithia morbida]KAF4121222.1 hypothetical protein GMORB2_2184 [Geosmithia morbida]